MNTIIEFCIFELISLGTKFQLKFIILIFWTKFVKKGVIPVKNRKTEHQHWILHIRISLCTKFQLKLTSMIFWTKFAEKGCFQSKMEKVKRAIELVEIPNFSIKWKFWFFGTSLSKKDISSLKQIKWTPPLNSVYSN